MLKPPKPQSYNNEWQPMTKKNEIISKMLQIEEMRTISMSRKASRDGGLGLFYQNTLSG